MQRVRRQASRVLLLDEAGRVLLLCSGGAGTGRTAWWFPPGGGLEVGETPEQAAVRELAEETGVHLLVGALGPVVHRRRVVFAWGGRLLDQDEELRVARLPPGPSGPPALSSAGWTPTERALLTATRWWTLAELERTEHQLAPPELPRLLAAELEA